MDFQYLKGAHRKDEEGIFFTECSNATRADGFVLKEGRLRLDIRKKLFIQIVMRLWNRLSRDTVDASFLGVFVKPG